MSDHHEITVSAEWRGSGIAQESLLNLMEGQTTQRKIAFAVDRSLFLVRVPSCIAGSNSPFRFVEEVLEAHLGMPLVSAYGLRKYLSNYYFDSCEAEDILRRGAYAYPYVKGAERGRNMWSEQTILELCGPPDTCNACGWRAMQWQRTVTYESRDYGCCDNNCLSYYLDRKAKVIIHLEKKRRELEDQLLEYDRERINLRHCRNQLRAMKRFLKEGDLRLIEEFVGGQPEPREEVANA